MAHNCEKCPIRGRYDKNPNSLIGRFWRWHIKYCPGWRKYFTSLEETMQTELTEKYQLKK